MGRWPGTAPTGVVLVKAVKVRAIYRAAGVAQVKTPYNSVSMKVYYPCRYGDSFEERNTGFIPADERQAPLPIVIIMPGINVSHESYGWLAMQLSAAGFVVVTYSWITVEMADMVSVSPGVSMAQLMHEQYGRQPSCPVLPALFRELARMQKKSVLAGLLDLNRIVIGGHSAGGTMALLNANTDWFPQLCGAFSYGAHTAANVQLGWAEDSMMPITRVLPLLILGGSRDGVIAASSHRYGGPSGGAGGSSKGGSGSDATWRIERTFHEAVKGKRGDRYLVIIEGANHFSFVWPADQSTGRPFLDYRATGSSRKIRDFIAGMIIHFCDYAARGDATGAANLQALCDRDNPLVRIAQQK